MKVSLFTKTDKPTVDAVIDYLRKKFGRVTVYRGKVGDPFPQKAFNDTPDVLISYLSAWIIPKKILDKTRYWNINFHPGPPEYPGTGCFNFAIYNNESTYGVTAHIMEERVDTGMIIGVKRFPLLKSDSVYELSLKCYSQMYSLLREVVDAILTTKKLPVCDEAWRRRPYVRKQLEELCRITPNMTKGEVARRIRATTYPNMPGAYIDLAGYTFEHNPNRRRLK